MTRRLLQSIYGRGVANNDHSSCHFSNNVDILISASDYRKLTQESKELLCAACEMAQLRCAKLINVRGKVSVIGKF